MTVARITLETAEKNMKAMELADSGDGKDDEHDDDGDGDGPRSRLFTSVAF